MMRCALLFALASVASAIGSAETWSGYLVDAKCYAALERNHNPRETQTEVDRDRGSEVRYCRATGKTKTFALVGIDGQSFDLDAAGNVQAVDLAKQRTVFVKITGTRSGGTVKVDSISAAK